jgi:uncharacterized protein (DUF1015 family)
MAEIKPFQGVLYNTQRVKPADVLTQPYDKITPEMRERYLKLSPYNLIQIELGKEQAGDNDSVNRYTRARDLYQAWRRDEVLRRSPKPALYFVEQTFVLPGGTQPLTRHGLIACVRLHHWDEDVILPHEHTLSKPKADRLSLLRVVGSQQGQIFMLYPKTKVSITELVTKAGGRSSRRSSDRSRESFSDQCYFGGGGDARPTIECTDDYGVVNKLWEIADPSAIAAAQAALRDLKFYIADGHHRYETALAFRDESRATGKDPDAPHEFVMATLVDMGDPGLVILPTHRTVTNLSGFERRKFAARVAPHFALEPQPSADAMLSAVRAGGHRLGMFDGEQFAVLRPKNLAALRPLFADKPPLWDTLDVGILHVAILEALLGVDEARLREEANIAYWREPGKALDQVRTGAAQVAFFLPATPVADVKAIADAHSRMPQKSTDFYPKLLSGMVIYEVRPDRIGVR